MSSGVERCRGVSSGVEGCRGVSRCRVWHLDTVEHGFSLDGVEGCRGVSRGVELVELAWGVEVSSRCRGLVSRCRGQGSVWDLFVRLQKPLLNDDYAARSPSPRVASMATVPMIHAVSARLASM